MKKISRHTVLKRHMTPSGRDQKVEPAVPACSHLGLVVGHVEGSAAPLLPIGQAPVSEHVAIIVLGELAQLNIIPKLETVTRF
jgi:hypothetical protein